MWYNDVKPICSVLSSNNWCIGFSWTSQPLLWWDEWKEMSVLSLVPVQTGLHFSKITGTQDRKHFRFSGTARWSAAAWGTGSPRPNRGWGQRTRTPRERPDISCSSPPGWAACPTPDTAETEARRLAASGVEETKKGVKSRGGAAGISCVSLLTARSAVSLAQFAPAADGLGHICS